MCASVFDAGSCIICHVTGLNRHERRIRFLDSLGLADERGEAAAGKKKTKNTQQHHNAASKAARRQGLKSSFATPDWLDQWPRGHNRVKSRVCMCLCVGGVCGTEVHVRNTDVNLDILQDWPSQGRPTIR